MFVDKTVCHSDSQLEPEYCEIFDIDLFSFLSSHEQPSASFTVCTQSLFSEGINGKAQGKYKFGIDYVQSKERESNFPFKKIKE
jgi:hypothetical protein